MRQRALDLAPTVLLGALGLAQLAGVDAGDRFAGRVGVNAIALLALVLPLVWRRRFPGAVLLAVVVANLVWGQLLFAPTDQVVLETWFALLVATWAAAVHGCRRELPLIGLALAVEIAETVLELARSVPPSTMAVPAVSFVVAVAAGRVVRHYRGMAAQLQQRTEELARERDARAREAVELERGRIARELHDLVTHALSVVVLHAAAERERLDPAEPAHGTLATVEEISRTALADLRRLLGLLRADDDGLAPQPTLADVPSLVGAARSAGVDVVLDPPVPLGGLDPALEMTAFRIVQEALTNVIRHAAPCRARVTVRQGGGGLRIDVANGPRHGGPPASVPSGGGHGLIGMRERARMFGGTFAAGPVPGGGFRVSAVLPSSEEAACPAAS